MTLKGCRSRRSDALGRLKQAGAGLFLAALSGCAPLPTVGAAGIPPISPPQARIWVYRDLQSSAIPARPFVRLNGTIAGIADQGGAFYRDVLPGHYHVTVDSTGTDVNQSSDVTLAAGQEAYIHIVQLDNWDESVGGKFENQRPTFYAWLTAPDVARVAVWRSIDYGGGPLAAATR